MWLNCDFTNSLRNICKLYLWLISLQMWYVMEITRGTAFSPPHVLTRTYLLGVNWRHKTLLLLCRHRKEYLKSWSTHTLQNWSPGSEDEGIKPQADPSKSHASWSYRESLQGDPTLQKPKALEFTCPFLPRLIHPKLQPYPRPNSGSFWAREEQAAQLSSILSNLCLIVEKKKKEFGWVKEGEILTFLECWFSQGSGSNGFHSWSLSHALVYRKQGSKISLLKLSLSGVIQIWCYDSWYGYHTQHVQTGTNLIGFLVCDGTVHLVRPFWTLVLGKYLQQCVKGIWGNLQRQPKGYSGLTFK